MNNKKLIKEIKKVLRTTINNVECDVHNQFEIIHKNFIIANLNNILNKPDELIIDVFKNNIDWNYISEYSKLSKGFIEYFQDEVNWVMIAIHQKLSEHLIEKFQDKFDWFYVVRNQKLSQEFIVKFWDTKLSRYKREVLLLHNKVITPEFILWLYKTNQDEEFDLIKAITKDKDLFQYCIMIKSQVSRVLIEFNGKEEGRYSFFDIT